MDICACFLGKINYFCVNKQLLLIVIGFVYLYLACVKLMYVTTLHLLLIFKDHV